MNAPTYLVSPCLQGVTLEKCHRPGCISSSHTASFWVSAQLLCGTFKNSLLGFQAQASSSLPKQCLGEEPRLEAARGVGARQMGQGSERCAGHSAAVNNMLHCSRHQGLKSACESQGQMDVGSKLTQDPKAGSPASYDGQSQLTAFSVVRDTET